MTTLYLKKRISKGKEYWSLIESYRNEEGKVKQKTICNLGIIEKAKEILRSNGNYKEFYMQLLSYTSPAGTSTAIHKIIHGNSLNLSEMLIDTYVDTCVTSPPYFGLRDYGVMPTYWPCVSYSPMVGLEEIYITEWTGCLGQEPTIEMYIGHLILIFREVWKVLKDNGTLWLNLGDSFAGSMKGMGGAPDPKWTNGRRLEYTNPWKTCKLKRKNLMCIPWRAGLALQADGWYLRMDNIWHKPNHVPEAVKDRPTRSHEYVLLLAKSEYYYYNSDAIKEPAKDWGNRDRSKGKYTSGDVPIIGGKHTGLKNCNFSVSGKNKRSVWTISPNPGIKSSHYATFPQELPKTCILAGCPEGGIVLDPFGGSGTTGKAAKDLGRGFICVEIKKDYVEFAEKRISG